MSCNLVPVYLSLFSGCGGLDQGFEQAGFRGILSVDIDPTALAVLKHNLKLNVQQLDLASVDPILTEPIDVLLAGSPCQGFSTAGLRKVDDPRNSLLFVAPRIAKALRPKVIVAENVLGVIAGSHAALWDALHQQLRALGYRTGDLRVDSSDLGVAQKRQRIFLIAWRTNATQELVLAPKAKTVLSDALTHLEGVANHEPILLKPDSQDFKIASRIGQGQKLTNSRGGDLSIHTWHIPDVFGRTNKLEREVLDTTLKLRRQIRRRDFGDADPVSAALLKKQFGVEVIQSLINKGYLRKTGHYVDLTHTFNGKYRRQRLDSPSRTVDTRFGDHQLFLHPTENRAFTVREAARLQGFGDDFIFNGTVTQQFRMIGNAVPPPVAHSVAELVRRLL
jgi:DNA (cytosine-5)-methyltransferase 1